MRVNEAWLINGIPGAGKSTTARELARRMPRAAHVEGDRLHECVVSGLVLPGGRPPEEERAQIHLCVRNQCLLAQSFAEAGFVPVLDYVVVSRARLEEYARRLPGLALHLVTLAPAIETALARDAARPEKTVAAAWAHLDAVIRQELQGVGLWVDNAALSLDETVHRILRHRERALVSVPEAARDETAPSENPLRIRPARPSDAAVIQGVVEDWWGRPMASDMLSAVFLTHFRETCLVAERDGEMLGFLAGFLSQTLADEAYIRLVVVHPRCRSEGIGRALYQAFFAAARRHDRTVIHSVTSPANAGSIAFHQRLGFTLVPQEHTIDGLPVSRDHHGRPGTDRVLFVKTLDP